MRAMRLLTAAIALAGLLSSCATPQKPGTLVITVASVPAGAMLVQNGAVLGQLPMTLTYNLSPEHISQGVFRATQLTAMWASGAKAAIVMPQVKWQPGPNNVTSTFTLHRPANAAGLDVDMMIEARLRMESEPSDAELAMWNQLGQSVGTAAALAAKRK